MVKEIVKYPDDRLRVVCLPVQDTQFDDQLKQHIEDLRDTMRHLGGIGISSPQIGGNLQVIVIDSEQQPNVFINPTLLSAEGEEEFEEGCLSFPNAFVKVKRPAKVAFGYQDVNGEPNVITTDGLLAVVLQHEYDHLHGKLFIDRISFLKRQVMFRKAKRLTDQIEKAKQ